MDREFNNAVSLYRIVEKNFQKNMTREMLGNTKFKANCMKDLLKLSYDEYNSINYKIKYKHINYQAIVEILDINNNLSNDAIKMINESCYQHYKKGY